MKLLLFSLVLCLGPVKPDPCGHREPRFLLSGEYEGNINGLVTLEAVSKHDRRKIQFFLMGQMSVKVDAAGQLRQARVELRHHFFDHVRDNSPFPPERGNGIYHQGARTFADSADLSGLIEITRFPEGSVIFKEGKLRVSLTAPYCGGTKGKFTLSFVDSMREELESMGYQVSLTDYTQVILILKSGEFTRSRQRMESAMAGYDALLASDADPTEVLRQWTTFSAKAAQSLAAEKNAENRLCLTFLHHKRAPVILEMIARNLTRRLERESSDPVCFRRSEALPELLRLADATTAFDLEPCTGLTRLLIFDAIRKKLENVIEFSLEKRRVGPDLRPLLWRVPLAGATIRARVHELTRELETYGLRRIRDHLRSLKDLQNPQDLCLKPVETAWQKARWAEVVVNFLTGSSSLEVLQHHQRISPSHGDCP